MKKHKQEIIGEICVFVVIVIYAFWPIGVAYGAKALPQIQFLAYTSLVGSILFFFTTLFKKEFHHFKKLNNIGWLLLYTILISVLPYGVMTYAARYTNAIDISLLVQTEAIYAVIIGWIVLKEHIQFNKLLGILSIVAANVLLLYEGGAHISMANLVIAMAPLSFVCANLVAKKLLENGVGWSPLLFFRSFIGGLIILSIAAKVEGLQVPPSNLWWFLFIFGFVLFGLEKIFWQMALHRMDMSKSGVLTGATPIFSFLFVYLLFNETPQPYQWAALALTMLGVLLVLRTRSKQWGKTNPSQSVHQPLP